MKSFKAPDPNGFKPFFFKCYWDVVGEDLWLMVREVIRIPKLPKYRNL